MLGKGARELELHGFCLGMTRLVFRFSCRFGPIGSVVLPEISRESQRMLTGEQIRTARKRAGMSQGQLAKAVGASLRAVGSWERDGNSPNLAEVRLREVLDPYLEDTAVIAGPGLEDASDAQLLAEIARRFARTDPQEKEAGEEHDRSAPTKDGRVAPVTPMTSRKIPAGAQEVRAARKKRDPK